MEWNLDPEELRVLGSLIEKEATTPEQYPLSINALVNACNQKSNRDPVMALNPGDVRAAVGRLTQRGLARMASSYGGRVSKYEHRLGNTPRAALELTREQLALLCILMLRGPQTPGELRSRTQRMADFAGVDAVESALAELERHPAGQLVVRLPREPGKRESRYRHCLGNKSTPDLSTGSAPVSAEERPAAPVAGNLEARVVALEQEVAELRALLSERQANP